MTKKIFFGTAPLKAEVKVLECRSSEGGTYALILDQTPFHPKGGGQPSDIGSIGGVPVISVLENESGEIVHLTEKAVECGPQTACVDEATRTLNTRLHSASHLISSFLESQGNWRVIKGNSFPGQARLYFSPTKPGSAVPSPDQITAFLENIASQNLPLKEKIDEESGNRFVTWGDLKGYPCGGTHILSTRLLGSIVITKCRLKKGELHINFDVKEQ